MLMCAPSTSASVRMIILSYLNLLMSNSSPIPHPNAAIIDFISLFNKIFSSDAFSTFSIFPLSGRTACVFLFLAVFTVPPAESPSTIYTSHSSGFFDVHAASLLFVSTSFNCFNTVFLALSLAFLAL